MMGVTNVKIKKRSFILIVAAFSLMIIAFLFFNFYRTNIDVFRQFLSFSVTINNQSDYDIVSLETGTVEGPSGEIKASKDYYSKTIKSGEKVKIKPKLSLTGEGGIYLKYNDSRGETISKAVCSYTESLSGYSEVTINNDKVTIEENCR